MEPNNTTTEFNMFGYRKPDLVIHPDDFRFGFDPLWDGLYPDISTPPSLLTGRLAIARAPIDITNISMLDGIEEGVEFILC